MALPASRAPDQCGGAFRLALRALACAGAVGPHVSSAVADAPDCATAEVLAAAPSARSVTVYRSPDRNAGAFDLNALGGFGLITETRLVSLPAGVSRLRFEGVADGIETASALVQGLPGSIIEKNRDARLLSPASLLEAAGGRPLSLLRTDRKSGRSVRVPVTLRAAADGGVVVQTADGIEALRCSGAAESLTFSETEGLSASPSLSVRVRTVRAATASVTLSYLTHGLDWAADYTASLSDDGKTVDLGAWITLSNANGQGFADARTQVVAGRLNRETGETEPLDEAGPILALCWPQGSTSDSAEPLFADRMFKRDTDAPAPSAATALREMIVVTAQRAAELEQLGDLKLYRIPGGTDIASRQSKQVRLLDRAAIPVTLIRGANLSPGDEVQELPASAWLRTLNDTAHHLGVPLPSGRIAVFSTGDAAPILRFESALRDLAVDEEVEFPLGDSPDIHVRLTPDSPARARARLRWHRAELSNARAEEVAFELRLSLPDGARLIEADHAVEMKNGRPIFRLNLPAGRTTAVKFEVRGARGQ